MNPQNYQATDAPAPQTKKTGVTNLDLVDMGIATGVMEGRAGQDAVMLTIEETPILGDAITTVMRNYSTESNSLVHGNSTAVIVNASETILHLVKIGDSSIRFFPEKKHEQLDSSDKKIHGIIPHHNLNDESELERLIDQKMWVDGFYAQGIRKTDNVLMHYIKSTWIDNQAFTEIYGQHLSHQHLETSSLLNYENARSEIEQYKIIHHGYICGTINMTRCICHRPLKGISTELEELSLVGDERDQDGFLVLTSDGFDFLPDKNIRKCCETIRELSENKQQDNHSESNDKNILLEFLREALLTTNEAIDLSDRLKKLLGTFSTPIFETTKEIFNYNALLNGIQHTLTNERTKTDSLKKLILDYTYPNFNFQITQCTSLNDIKNTIEEILRKTTSDDEVIKTRQQICLNDTMESAKKIYPNKDPDDVSIIIIDLRKLWSFLSKNTEKSVICGLFDGNSSPRLSDKCMSQHIADTFPSRINEHLNPTPTQSTTSDDGKEEDCSYRSPSPS